MSEKKPTTIDVLHKGYQNISIYVYYISLALVAIGLLFSRAMVSIGFISFIGNWIIEGGFPQKWNTFKKNKEGMIISFIFLMHIIGMLHTENIPYGFSELRVKLPLLLPIFYGSSDKLLKSIKPRYFLQIFIAATVFASIIAFIRFEFISDYQTVEDLNKIAIIGQNIRLSLFVNLSIFSLFFILISYRLNTYNRFLVLFAFLWLVLFLYLLNSLTGHISFIFLLIFSVLYPIKKKKRRIVFYLLSASIIISGFAFSSYLNKLSTDFNKPESSDFQNLNTYTANGNIYFNDTLSNRIENGHYIDIYICRKELKTEWETSSDLPFSGKDNKGQELSETLIRYLSSKGLRKDSAGFRQLNKADIGFIENGCANYKYINKYGPESRIYNILWQLNTYKHTGNATAQSISQRIEFIKAAMIVIKENFWFGVGTGDVMDTFHQVLENTGSKMEEAYRNRVHNQYIVEFTALGVFGFLLFLFITIYPIIKFKIWTNYLFSVFYMIILLSYFTDNTLETQLGVSFYSYFYSLFCFGYTNSKY